MKNIYKVFCLFFFTSITAFSFGQAGVDCNYTVNSHTRTTITYCRGGYYEGTVVNIGDLVTWTKGSSSYELSHCSYTINGVEVASNHTYKTTPPDYYLSINQTTEVTITIGERIRVNDGTVWRGDYVLRLTMIPLEFNPPLQVCLNASSFSLRDYIRSTAGEYTNGGFPLGVFSGTGVSNNVFNPQTAGVGSHTITFRYGEKTITKTISVVAPANVTTSFPSSIHNTNSVGGIIGRMDLRSYVNPIGGSFQAIRHSNGGTQTLLEGRYLNLFGIIPEDNFNVSSENVTVVYSYTNGPCTQTFSNVVAITNNNIDIKMSDLDELCANNQEYDLRVLGNVSPSGGTFTVTGGLRLFGEGNSLFATDREGAYNITYKVTKNGYSKEITKFLRIREVPTLSFSRLPTICTDTKINLSNYVEPSGGTFSGTGVVGNEFFPSLAEIGEHIISYSFSNSYGCVNTIKNTINVLEIISGEIQFTLPENICQDANPIYLRQYINHVGGTFSGQGVTGEYFDPGIVGSPGLKQITYRIQNGSCKQEFIKTINVRPRPALVFNSIGNICKAGTIINLFDYVSPKDKGFFSGKGVVDNKFYASTAGKGVHNIKFEYTDSNGCKNEITQAVTVVGLIPQNIVFQPLPNVCSKSSTINLRDYINNENGTFSGRGVTGDVFNPTSAGVGTHAITYRYADDSCVETFQQNITVLSETNVVFNSVPTICYKDKINLMSYVGSHIGGTFYGPGVTDNFFYPEIAGLGLHVITYNFKNTAGCETIVSQTLRVDLLIESEITFALLPEKCVNSSSIFLRDFINTTSGSFSGRGVTGEYFNPASAGVGTWTITWTQTNGGCTNQRTTTVNVVNTPAVAFNALPNICYQDAIINLMSYVGGHTGGVFTGPGVVGSDFHAEQAGVGIHTINYLYKSGDCEVLKQQTINVRGLLNSGAVFSPINNVCVTGNTINLSNYVNISGGVFSGPGVTGAYFNPSAAGVGLKEVKYTLSHGTCTETLTRIIDVQNLTGFTFNSFPIICTSNPVYLNNYISPFRNGGVFSGKGVVDNVFHPETAGVGQHLITYQYLNSSGCETILTQTISVDQLLGEVKWIDIENVCKNSSPIYLPNYINHSGGTFSGQGVNGEYFNPSNVNPGNYTIKYKASGGRCNEEFSTVIVVSQGPNVTFSNIPPICFDEKINLNNYVSHTGLNAKFSGPGIDGNFFSPADAGRGLHTIVYSYKNALGCETTLTQTVNVVDLLKGVIFNDIPSTCASSPIINLNNFIENHTGGIFSGPGVQGNIFNPSSAGEGLHLVTYTINNGSCHIQLQKNIEVFKQETVLFNKINDLCFVQSIDLTRYVSPVGGEFSGIGVEGNRFNPVISGLGSFLIEYTYTSSNGCKTIAKQTINVVELVALDIKLEAFPEICDNSNTLYLPDYVNHTGGTFSGRGVTGSYFNPTVAGKGVHLVTYRIAQGTCIIELQGTIHVFSPDEIVFSTVPNVCYDAPINLFNYVSPQGGEFSGPGVVDGIFYPANLGIGEYTIAYEYTNAKGCRGTTTRVIKVVNLLSSNIVFSALPDVCPESSVVNLRNYINSVEGEFVGRGVTDGYFDPTIAGSGVHKIEFRIINGACRIEKFQSIIVKKPTVITFQKLPEICNPETIDLSSFVVPKGGQFAGNGVTGNIFSPSVAGIGTHEITYLLNDGTGCVNQVKQSVTVTNLTPKNLSLNKMPDVCTNSQSIRLSDYLSHNVNGVFSGPGVSGEYFNPSQAGKGVHQITYTIGQGNCRLVLKETISVLGKDDNVVFYTLPEVCINKQIDLIDYISKHVGQFSGVGVQSNKFNPASAGVGTHTISYLYQNELGCEFVLSQTIHVRDLMPSNITFSNLPDVCPDNPAVKLSDYTNYSGTFSGSGISGEYFNPSNVNPGTYTINFTYSTGICQGTIKQTITVKRKEQVFFSDVLPICKNRVIELTQYVFPQGGVFSGPGISGGKFYPQLAGTGVHVITYQFTNSLNCNSVIQKEIRVLELIEPDIQFKALPDICINSSPVKLSEYLTNAPTNGKFTGTGVEGEYFNPLTAGAGAWTITYEVGSATSCKETYRQTLVVHTNDNVEFIPLPVVCTHREINLFNYVSHKTGTFSGPGVVDGKFSPSQAGTGNHMIVYNFKSHSGCESVHTQFISIPRLYSSVSFNPIGEVCQNAGVIQLNNYVNVAGGNFSGTGVENNLFNPSIAKGGSHKITYTLGNEHCNIETSETITVIGIPDITFNALPDVCFNEPVRLNEFTSHQGTFSGSGVENNIFYPNVAGQGKHKISFSYMQNGCMVQLQNTIEVLSLNNVNIEFYHIDEMCVNASVIDLSIYTNARGNFSGTGVQGNTFNPSTAGVGTHELILSVGQGSCQKQLRQFVTVYNITPLTANNITICNGQSIDLNSVVNITGGEFSGQHIAANYFYPEKTGEFQVKYTYQNRNGCASSITFLIKVDGLHPQNVLFNELPSKCTHDTQIDLRNFVSHFNSSSKFSGPGVQGYFFSPEAAKNGTHQITYTIGENSCKKTLTQTIQVNAPSNVTFDIPLTICNDKNLDLNEFTNAPSARITGPGIISNVLYPASAGLGTHVITLRNDNSFGCVTTIQKTIKINALNPHNISFIKIADVCENQSRIKLTDYVSDANMAVFSGKGVNGQYFYPSQAGSGTHVITCKIGLVSGCISEYTQIINVLALPAYTFSALPDLCFDKNINLSTYVNVEGGYFSGNGVVDSFFYPSQAGTGNHLISYTLIDEYGCQSVKTQTITVRSLFNSNISFSSLPNVCINGDNLNLINYVSEFVGTFSGPGVSNSIFSPKLAGIGTHAVKYVVGNQSCASEFIQYITVFPITSIDFFPLPVICYNSIINLDDYVSIKGGVFSGTGVIGNQLQTESLDVGLYNITYFYNNNNGCQVTATQLLEVKGKNSTDTNIEFSSIPSVCVGSTPIDLRDYVTIQGGTFSGQGVIGNLFNPSAVNAGVYLITYSFGVGECETKIQKEVIVKNAPAVEFFAIPELCKNNSEVILHNYVSHQGGIFEGPGINNGVLRRSELNKGTHVIYYHYLTNDGCSLEISQTINIGDIVPNNLHFSNPGDVCENGGSINLFTLINYDSGNFSGTGVNENGYFIPSIAGEGVHRITYTLGQGSCQTRLSQYINVSPPKNIEFTSIGKVCTKTPIPLSDYVNFKGGVFSGRGVENNTFDPVLSGEGIHRITYSYFDELCHIQVSQNVEVLNIKELYINVDRSAVESSALVKFWSSGFDIENYRWEFGDGGYSLEKEPFHYYYHLGDFSVTLICQDKNGCVHTVNKENFITVNAYSHGLKSVISINDEKAIVGIHYEDIDFNKNKNPDVFPNPFKDRITIANLPVNKVNNILVTDINGRIVYRTTVSGQEEITISLEHLAAGVYFIRIDETVEKIIKN